MLLKKIIYLNNMTFKNTHILDDIKCKFLYVYSYKKKIISFVVYKNHFNKQKLFIVTSYNIHKFYCSYELFITLWYFALISIYWLITIKRTKA